MDCEFYWVQCFWCFFDGEGPSFCRVIASSAVLIATAMATTISVCHHNHQRLCLSSLPP